jgi:hypothetical protein
MFILYAIPLGIVLGYLMGGRLEGLAALRFQWAWLAIVGLLVQAALFSPLVGDLTAGGVGEVLYVASTAAVLLAVLRNIGIAGLVLVALGAVSNLAAVVANGGIMPTTLGALETAGLAPRPGFSNSAVVDDPALAPLTDVYALPAWVPFANVFSVGDVLIGLGIVVVIAFGMRRSAD